MSFTASLDEIIFNDKRGLLAQHPGWSRIPLGAVAKILNGFPFSSTQFSRESGFPLLRIRDIVRDVTESRFTGGFDEQYIVEPGDLVVGMDGDFNSVIWKGPRALLNQRVCKIEVNPRFYSKLFLAYVLPGYLEAVNQQTSSVTVKHLSSRTIAEIPLPLPPLAEQLRIVAEIEKQLTRVDAGIGSVERTLANLKRYRSAILKAACEGRLVPTETELAESEEMASSVHLSPATPIPPGWRWTTLPQLGKLARGKSKHRPRNDPKLYGGSYPFIQTGDVRHSGGWIRSYEATYNETGLTQSQLWPPSTLCITIAANIAATGILTFAACFPDSVVGFTYDGDIETVRYVEFFIRTIREDLESLAPATAQKNINLDTLSRILIPLPPPAEQKRIVAEVDRRISVLDELEKAVHDNLRRAETLRQSILRRAFKGELVPQDPNDEPVSVLLERIRLEREATAENQPRRRGRRSVAAVNKPRSRRATR